MKAIELKCNNYVMLYNNVARIIPNDFVKWSDEKWEMKDFKPIPLTEEWLLKFGFGNGVVKGGFSFDKNKLSIHLKSTSYPNGRTYFNSWCILEYAIQYVHQLQNLYFALTNTELEIK